MSSRARRIAGGLLIGLCCLASTSCSRHSADPLVQARSVAEAQFRVHDARRQAAVAAFTALESETEARIAALNDFNRAFEAYFHALRIPGGSVIENPPMPDFLPDTLRDAATRVVESTRTPCPDESECVLRQTALFNLWVTANRAFAERLASDRLRALGFTTN